VSDDTIGALVRAARLNDDEILRVRHDPPCEMCEVRRADAQTLRDLADNWIERQRAAFQAGYSAGCGEASANPNAGETNWQTVEPIFWCDWLAALREGLE